MARTKGLFVSLEGPNGVGKSSILSGVVTQLAQSGFDVFQTREPTRSPLGQFVRDGEEVYKGKVLACLVGADRYFHLDHEIMPALSEGKIVICDRYIESSLVLQRLDGVDVEFIWSLNSQVYVPDLSVILTARAETLDRRLASGRTKYSRFERDSGRAMEIQFYQEAADFLLQRGFKIVMIENDSTTLDKNIEKIVQKIKALTPV